MSKEYKGERLRIVPRCSQVQNTTLSSLTSRFGMDLGVPCSLWSPTKYNYEEDYLKSSINNLKLLANLYFKYLFAKSDFMGIKSEQQKTAIDGLVDRDYNFYTSSDGWVDFYGIIGDLAKEAGYSHMNIVNTVIGLNPKGISEGVSTEFEMRGELHVYGKYYRFSPMDGRRDICRDIRNAIKNAGYLHGNVVNIEIAIK